MIKFEVINLQGETLAIFDNEDQAHNFADYQINYCYVEQFNNGECQ